MSRVLASTANPNQSQKLMFSKTGRGIPLTAFAHNALRSRDEDREITSLQKQVLAVKKKITRMQHSRKSLINHQLGEDEALEMSTLRKKDKISIKK